MPILEGVPDYIRIANPGEDDSIFSILSDFHAENGVFSLCERKVRERIAQGLAAKGDAVILVIDGNDEIAASVGLGMGEAWYTEEWSINEYWFYVRPAYRHSHFDQDLVNTIQALSDRWKLAGTVGVTSTHRTEAKMRLFARRMKMIGGLFAHGLEYASGPVALALRKSADDVQSER
jgi:hypothetical protein